MRKYSVQVLVIAGIMSLTPSFAGAVTGKIIECAPTVGLLGTLTLTPALNCASVAHKIAIAYGPKTLNPFDNCSSPVPSATWDGWAVDKIGSKTSGADAALIAKAGFTIKGIIKGSCDLSGLASAYNPSGFVDIQYYDAGGNKVKNGKSTVYIRVAIDVLSQSALLIGIVTKGPGVGADVTIQLGVDVNDLINNQPALVGCTLGGACNDPNPDPFIVKAAKPGNVACIGAGDPDSTCSGQQQGGRGCKGASMPSACCTALNTGTCYDPVPGVPLSSNSDTKLLIAFPTNSDCVAASDPYLCCTGSGTGTCH